MSAQLDDRHPRVLAHLLASMLDFSERSSMSMWNLRSLAECVLDAPQDRGINVGLARDLGRAAIQANDELSAARRENATLREALERIERLAWPSPQWTTRSTILSVARAALAASPAAEEQQP